MARTLCLRLRPSFRWREGDEIIVKSGEIELALFANGAGFFSVSIGVLRSNRVKDRLSGHSPKSRVGCFRNY